MTKKSAFWFLLYYDIRHAASDVTTRIPCTSITGEIT